VLVVEDSEDDADLLLIALRRSGFEVSSLRVDTAPELRRALAEHVWDVIVSDYSMPQLDAPLALKILKDTALDIPFLVVSGTINEEMAVDALRAGAHDFMAKGKLARLAPAIERELREVAVREAVRRAEQALRESELRYRRIIESTNEGVWVLDAEARTSFVNARTASMLGRDVSEILDKPLLDFLHDPSGAPLAVSLAERRACVQLETKLERADGSTTCVSLDSTPIFDVDGRYEGALVMATDITHRKQLEDQLRHVQKMEAVGSLAGGVAHDFNNILSIVLSCSSLLLDKLPAGDPNRADLEEIREAGERAAELTRQLLAFSRRQVLQPRILDLNQVLDALRSMLRRLVPAHIEFSLPTSHALGKVRADRSQMEQVIMNLVVNARDAIAETGEITITTSDMQLDAHYASTHVGVTPGSYVMLAVTDTGIGMDAATRGRIFEPFFTTKEQGKGTGLGLATVFGIVQQSGGHIWVHSDLGKGTTFEIYLPRSDAALDLPSSIPAAPATVHGSETILLVEDDAGVRSVARGILLGHGYHVLEAQNGCEALLVSENQPAHIQLLITDVIMPHMGGRELAERLAPLRPGMKVLFVSGYTEDTNILHGTAFLQKPITPDMFLRKVREVLDAPRLTRRRDA
jgi:PAS domain S-box-containing protein